MPQFDPSIVGLPQFKILDVGGTETVEILARYEGGTRCPHCGGQELRTKDSYVRRLRHASFGTRPCFLSVEARKYHCRSCGKYFNQQFPGIGKWRRSTEPFRRQIFTHHHEGISQRALALRERLGSATVERWYQELLAIKIRERVDSDCPKVLGIDEHFFSRKDGFATTFCNLGRQKIFDVALGRSERALEPFLAALTGKEGVRVVCMDLSETYRGIVRKHFRNALIVADRFHVIRLLNDKFLSAWSQLDPRGRSNRGLLSLIRRHPWHLSPDQQIRVEDYLKANPVFRAVYEFKQRLVRLLLIRQRTQRQCRRLVPLLLHAVSSLRASPLAPLRTLGETFDQWKEEIARMWRFTKNNGITEGFHTKMEMITRRAFGFRNFENYRLRVRVLCG